MKGRNVIIKQRKRLRPIHKGPAALKSDPKTSGKPVESAIIGVGERELHLARALSDTEREARDGALATLELWLREHSSDLSDADWDRLWKALFYCLWMADTRPVISLVIKRVVGLGDVAGWPYIAAMYRCVSREWHGIDRHRVDKFYELITVALKNSTARLLREGTSSEGQYLQSIATFIDLLQTNVFERAAIGASGVALHIMDYWIDCVLSPSLLYRNSKPSNAEIWKRWEKLMQIPFSILGAQKATVQALSLRTIERVISVLPDSLSEMSTGLDEKLRDKMLRNSMETVWRAAASHATLDGVRKHLYTCHRSLKIGPGRAGARDDCSVSKFVVTNSDA